jgi:hypothetical protein
MGWVVVEFDKEASQTRDYCVAKDATRRAARPGSFAAQRRLLRMTGKLLHYPGVASGCEFVHNAALEQTE